MNVGSLLEIYTTMFGWAIYDSMYDLFRGTGLLLFPFLLMIIRNWKEPLQSQNDKAASLVSQSRVNFDAFAMIAVFMIAVVPTSNVDLNEFRYRVACTNQAGGIDVFTDVDGDDTGSTYDAQLAAINNVSMPVLWWLTLSVGAGVNAAISTSFACFEDIKGLDMQLRNLTIQDQALRNEYIRFANECYLPSKSKYAEAMRGGQHYQHVARDTWTNFLISRAADTGGNRSPEHDDWMFIGSHYYLETSGFYKEHDKRLCANMSGGCGFQAKNGVYNWPVNQARDFYPQNLIDFPDSNKPLYGKPFCDEWWEDDVRGVKNKLLNSIEASRDYLPYTESLANETLTDKVIRVVRNGFASVGNATARYTFTDEQIEDLVINNYVKQDPPSFSTDKGGLFGANEFADIRTNSAAQTGEQGAAALAAVGVGALALKTGAAKTIFNVAKGTGASGGNSFGSQLIDFYTNMFIAKQAAPMVQAIILMMIYMLLLVYMIMSNYDIDATINMIFIILAIQFFTTLWNFADYLDAQLFVSMHPDATLLGSVYNMGANRLILDIVLTLFYVVAPFLLLWIMNMAGNSVGNLGGSMGPLGKPSGSKGASEGVKGGARCAK
jgi:hypothetical protein